MAVVITAALAAIANALANGFVLDDGAIVRTQPARYDTRRGVAGIRNAVLAGTGLARDSIGLSVSHHSRSTGSCREGTRAGSMLSTLSGMRWRRPRCGCLRRNCSCARPRLIAALIFAVHPVHVEAVANVVGRLERMAAVFVLGALLAHRRGDRAVHHSARLRCPEQRERDRVHRFGGGARLLLSKNWRAALSARRWWYASYGVVVLAYVLMLAAVFHDRALAMEARVLVGATALERMALVAKVIPHYARLLLAPAELSASYAPNVIMPDGGLSSGTMLGVTLLVLAALAFVGTVRARRWPVMAFAMLWVPVALSPVSNVFFASGILLAERTLYLSSVGVCLGVGAIAERMLATRRTAVLTGIAVVLLAFAARTWTRTPVWRDDRAWLLTLLADHPESYEAHRTAGGILKGAGQLDHAARELTIARELYPRDPLVYREAADVALRQRRTQLAAALRDSARLAPTLPLPRR